MSLWRTNLLDCGRCNPKPEHPNSTTDRSLPGAPKVSSPNSTFFPFSRLSTELRLQIFEVFALPKIPLAYCIWPLDCPHTMFAGGGGVEPIMGEFWSLGQVSREARQAVLRGRQVIYDYRIRHGRKVARIMFVNWNYDLVNWALMALSYFDGAPLPTWRANIQHLACELLHRPDGEFSLDRSPVKASLINLATYMPSLRCVYFILEDVPIPEYWKGYKFSINRLILDRSGIRVLRPAIKPRPARSKAKNAPAAQRGYWQGIPISVETIISRYPGEPEEGLVELCDDLMQRLNRFVDDMQDLVLRECGRAIKCKVIGPLR
ncbi:hypothetical protein F4782DRAFT_492049 [Xylaria castorea]|nr:hypothetical protein F4782DRAFT_492049 [Xylaria castorea]